jgi:hypothetical protein
MLDPDTVHAMVVKRHAEIRQLVIDAQLELEATYPNDPRTKVARIATKRRMPGIAMPPLRQPETFLPPDLKAEESPAENPFAGITVADLVPVQTGGGVDTITAEEIATPTLEEIEERIRAVSFAMNTPAGRRDSSLMQQLLQLQDQKNALE